VKVPVTSDEDAEKSDPASGYTINELISERSLREIYGMALGACHTKTQRKSWMGSSIGWKRIYINGYQSDMSEHGAHRPRSHPQRKNRRIPTIALQRGRRHEANSKTPEDNLEW